MSDVDSQETEAPEAEADDKSLIDRAKEAAADIDVQALMAKARTVAGDVKDKSVDAAGTVKDKSIDAAGTVKDKSIDAAGTVKEKVSGFVGDNEDKIDKAIEKTGHFVDDKLTRHKFTDKIDKAQELAKDAVHKVGHPEDSTAEVTTASTGDEQ